MALSEIKPDGFRRMFFSPLASHREFTVSTEILRDSTRLEESFHDFAFLEERAPNSHTTSRVIDEETGVMLFNLIDQNAVGCWHTSLPYSPKYHGIVDRDDVTLVFPSDVKIDENKDVWVLSDRMPVFLIAELDYSDVNFRIFSAPLNSLVQGTVCEVQNPFYSRFNTASDYQTTLRTTPIIPSSKGPFTTQRIAPVPKAFVYSRHSGVEYETQSPQSSPYFRGAAHHSKASWFTRQLW